MTSSDNSTSSHNFLLVLIGRFIGPLSSVVNILFSIYRSDYLNLLMFRPMIYSDGQIGYTSLYLLLKFTLLVLYYKPLFNGSLGLTRYSPY